MTIYQYDAKREEKRKTARTCEVQKTRLFSGFGGETARQRRSAVLGPWSAAVDCTGPEQTDGRARRRRKLPDAQLHHKHNNTAEFQDNMKNIILNTQSHSFFFCVENSANQIVKSDK